MAPVTRGRSNVHRKDSIIASPMSERGGPTFISIDETIKKRGKRKSMGDFPDEKGPMDATPNSKFKTPKRQKLTLQTTEEKTPSGGRRKQIKAEIPSSATKRMRSSPVADSQDEQEDSSNEIEYEPTSASRQLMEEASQQFASRELDPDPTPRPKPKSKHVVFGNDDDVEKFVAEGAEVEKDIKELIEEAGNDEEEEDDDDAPEAVSTQAAAKESLKSAQAAAEAAEKHAASLKRKRQERDNLFKQQAEKRKQTRTEEQPPRSPSAADSDQDEAGAAEKQPTAGRRRAEKHKLPDVLPASFLEDSPSGSEDDGTALKRVAKKPKKITFDAAARTLSTILDSTKRPRDEIVGATRFRVLAEQGDAKLAPKAHKNARLVKEALLQRRRTAVAPNKKKGFFLRR